MSVLCFRQHELVGGGNFATLALSRPEVNNALNSELLEAMSAGCTLVASDTEPVKEVLVDGHNARLVHFFDVGGIADTVIELLENSNERFQLGENARSSVKERFDLKHVCLPQQIDWVEKLIVR